LKELMGSGSCACNEWQSISFANLQGKVVSPSFSFEIKDCGL
jgi:hypothetical protein